jgi:hypothetical protein
MPGEERATGDSRFGIRADATTDIKTYTVAVTPR